MQAYSEFAIVYDMFMDNVPYDAWADYLLSLLNEYGIHHGSILELGCGTGSITNLLSKAGYKMTGIDYSIDMLSIAKDKSMELEQDILYLWQDMREFEIFGTVEAIISVCDTMNYILEEEDLLKVFKLVECYLKPKGLFIFDLDTIYAYKEILGDHTIAENREEGSFIWENTYHEEDMINEINLSLFIPQEDGVYHKYDETHYRKAYDLERIKELIIESGLAWEGVFNDLSHDKPKNTSERVFVIASKK